jgi:hypothetical protein
LVDGFIEDQKNLARIALAKDVEAVAKELSEIRKAITEISNAPSDIMNSREKREAITELRALERELLKAVPLRELRKEAKL